LSARAKPLSLHSNQGLIDYTVVHRPRVTRRLHLELDDAGELVVVAPRSWPTFHVVQLLRQNLPYVERFLERARARQLAPLEFCSGSQHYYRGETFRLQVQRGQHPARVCLHEGKLLVSGRLDGPEAVQKALRRWYLGQAQDLFAQRLAHWRQQAHWAHGRQVELMLRRMTRTWGTCNRHGVIRLNTHLVKAPPECLDYVIAHELCHLAQMNHGARFYALQASIYPGWAAVRAHLREFGPRYTRE
jgi:predicted metal-dependent hydrolase